MYFCYNCTSHTYTVISGSDSHCVCAKVPDFCLHSWKGNTLTQIVYELACVNLAACYIFMWSLIFNPFVGLKNSLFSYLLIPVLEFECCWYALLTFLFVVYSLISKTTLLLQTLKFFAFFYFSLVRLLNTWTLPIK